MTLAEVAADVRARQAIAEKLAPTAHASIESIGVLLEAILYDFEADPDFQLRNRVEALVVEFDRDGEYPACRPIFARRLRDILNVGDG